MLTHHGVPLTVSAKEWLNTFQPESKITYYTGYLATDRGHNYETHKLAKLFLDACGRGEVTLYQKKISAGTTLADPVYEYNAEKLL
tara:strand:+ start:243 stop:500 length:258 start_codon:yes stop_codon:yes gene_type:complete